MKSARIAVSWSLLMLAASSLADPPTWPPLDQVRSISGRAATEADVEAGRAVFVAKSGDTVVGQPIDITIPQYAYHLDPEASPQRTPVIIIQAERAQGNSLIGFLEFGTGQIGAGLQQEFELLGTTPPVE